MHNNFPESSNAPSSLLSESESSDEVNQAPMKKTLFYDFLPSKAVEDAERAENIPHQAIGQLIEIRDEYSLSESSNAPSLPPSESESSDDVNQAPMKKTLFYDFLPSKAVEDAERAEDIPHQATWQLIEIHNECSLSGSKPHDCPTLIKVIDEVDVDTEKLSVSHHRAFDCMFRHWPLPVVQAILTGGQYTVKMIDNTDDDHGSGASSSDDSVNQPLQFCGGIVSFAKWRGMDHYFLNLSELFRARRIAVGDVIHCRWDTQNECFVLKVVRKET